MKRIVFNQSFFSRIFSFIPLFLLLNGGLWVETAVSAAPETIPVACTDGIGDTSSLISAIEQANNSSGLDIIELGRNCAYRLFQEYAEGSGLPLLKGTTTIEGNGATIYRQPSFGSSAKFNLLKYGRVPYDGGTNIILKNLYLYNGDTIELGGAFSARPFRFDNGGGNGGVNYVNVTLENVVVRNNAAKNGGGIYIQSPGQVIIINSKFERNEAGYGGGVYWDGEERGQLTITENSSFAENEAENGGGLFAESGVIGFSGVHFSKNVASQSGGGLHLTHGAKGSINSATFDDNRAIGPEADGGGMSNSGRSTPILSDVIFIHNKAGRDGGGLMNNGSGNPTLIQATFSSNRAVRDGGGMMNLSDSDSAVFNTVFRGNFAGRDGGGLTNLVGSDSVLANVTFSGNFADRDGGGMVNRNNCSPTLTNVSFNGNAVSRNGGGMVNTGNCNASLINTILWHNADQTGMGTLTANLFHFNTTAQISYSLVQGSGGSNAWIDEAGTDNGNNIDGDPQFVMPVDTADSPTIEGNLRLQAASPAINVGNNDVNGFSVDLDGNPRIQNDVIDLGAYESPYLGNVAPEAESDLFFTLANETLVVKRGDSILNNDSDADGDELTAVLTEDVEHGELALNEDGTFEYTPDRNFTGRDSFTYVADDTQLTSEPTHVDIIVRYVANDDQYEGLQDTQLNVAAEEGILANDIAPEGLFLSLEENVTQGNLTLNDDGSFSYTPDAGFVGQDQFAYRLAASLIIDSEIATVTITIGEEPNQPPIAEDDAYSVDENETLNVSTSNGILDNDSDPDGDELEARLVEPPEFGDLDLDADGSFHYTPGENFFGEDSFTYQVDDGEEHSETATVRITVNEVNSPPVAADDSYSMAQDQFLVIDAVDGILSNDSDVDGDSLRTRFVSGTGNGTFGLSNDGSFTYEPNEGFFGTDSFQYQADDGRERSNVATVTITVERVNGPPVATNDAYQLQQGETLEVAASGVLANDSDPDDDALEAVLVTVPSNGGLILNSDGSFTYMPNPDFFGSDSFSYQADDGTELSNIATVVLTIEQANTPPVAEDDAYLMAQGTVLEVPAAGVLGNDGDGDGDGLTAVLLTPPTDGTLDFQADGSFNYTPDPAFIGEASFTYQATDGEDSSESATVTITVQEVVVNTPPVAQSNGYETAVDTLLVIAAPGVLSNDSDADGDGLTAELVSSPENGTLIFNSDGSFTYEPAPGFFGNDSFRYLAHDGELPSAPAMVFITVTPPPPPVEPVPYQLFLPIIVRSN